MSNRDEVVRYSMYLNDDDSSFGQKEVDNEVDKYTETCGDITIEVKYIRQNLQEG